MIKISVHPGIALFTVIEDLALVAWLALVRAGRQVLGALVLPIGFFLEHLVAQKVKGGPLTPTVLNRLAVNALIESVIWIIWLALWPFYQFSVLGVGIPAIAILWLQASLTVEHNLTDNIFHDRPLFSGLFRTRVYGFTALENIAASGAMGLLGAGLPVPAVLWLVTFQYLEHKQAIDLARRT